MYLAFQHDSTTNQLKDTQYGLHKFHHKILMKHLDKTPFSIAFKLHSLSLFIRWHKTIENREGGEGGRVIVLFY